MKKRKFKVYSYEDKVRYYSDILLDNKSTRSKKIQANRWFDNNYYNNKFNSSRLSKTDNQRINTGVNKFLNKTFNSPYKNIKKRK